MLNNNKIVNLLLTSIFTTNLLAFDLEKQIMKEAKNKQIIKPQDNNKTKKEKEIITFTNKRKLKQFIYKKQREIVISIYKNQKTKILSILNEVNSIPSIEKDLKIEFNTYVFWRYINFHSINTNLNNFYSFEKNEMVKEKQFIYKLVNFIDFEYNKESKEVYFAFHLIALDKKSLNIEFDKFVKKFFPYGISDKDFYYKFFILVNSKIIKYNSKYDTIYHKIFEEFIKYYKNINGKITDKLLTLYIYANKKLKQDLKDEFIKNSLLEQISKNPYNSDLFYFLALYYKPRDLLESMKNNNNYFKSYIKNLELAIQYNIYNIEAWKEYINGLILIKKYEQAMKFVNYSLKHNTTITNIKAMTYYKGYIYYLIGLKNKDINMLKTAYKTFKEINNNDYLETIKKYIKIFSNK